MVDGLEDVQETLGSCFDPAKEIVFYITFAGISIQASIQTPSIKKSR